MFPHATRGSHIDTRQVLDGVKNTFSSWDSCMSKAYCKWPVIAAIVIGSLIVLSILFCCIRCLCCGVECCCGICSCFNACCPSPRRRRDKTSYDNPPYRPVGPPPQPYQQYQSHAPPSYASPAFSPAPVYNSGRPQYAQFDASRPSNPDALPSMPSWDHAQSKQVEVFEDPSDHVEMNDLDHNGHKPGTADSQAPMMAGYATGAAAAHVEDDHGRPGMFAREPSHNTYADQSPYDQRSPHGAAPASPYDEDQAFIGDGRFQSAGGRYPAEHEPYHGAASPLYAYISQQSHHEEPLYVSHSSSPPAQTQYQRPQQQEYQAFSPQGTQMASYPGQRAFQSGAGPTSPVSPMSPQHMDYSSHGTSPGRDYLDQDQSQQRVPGYGQRTQARHGSNVNRRPVDGSWRDI